MRRDRRTTAKLYFYYASMNAGKSTLLLQADFNYRECGLRTRLYTARLDDRHASGTITSRIGLRAPAHPFDAATDLYAETAADIADAPLACVLVDEAQFLARAQVAALARIADDLRVPVLAYGLRTDFQGVPFEGSLWLLAVADVLSEIKSVCRCGAKATMNLRVDGDGRAVIDGAQTEIGGNERYVALCRRHFIAARADGAPHIAARADGAPVIAARADGAPVIGLGGLSGLHGPRRGDDPDAPLA